MDLELKQRIFAYNIARLMVWAYENGYELATGEFYRTPEQQAIYLKEGKTKVKESQHMKKLAADLLLKKTPTSGYEYITDTNAYKPLGDIWVSLHPDNRWGGDWNMNGQTSDESFLDGNHFEMR